MKNKNKIFLFAAALLFLSIFFVGINGAEAQSTYAECLEYGGDHDDCSEYPVVLPDLYGATNNSSAPNIAEGLCDPFESRACCENNENSGFWYGNTCNAYPPEVVSSDNNTQRDECPSGSVWNGLSCTILSPPIQNDDPSTCDPFKSQTCCENAVNGGNWFNNTCNVETQAVNENRTCDPFKSQTCCENANNGGFWYEDTCNVGPRGAGSTCSASNACPDGYKCDGFGKCLKDGVFGSSDCNNNSDCYRIFGSGYECNGVFIKTCEKVTTSSGAPANSNNGARPVASTTADSNVGGRRIPAGSQVNSDGSATNPATGEQIAPPGSFPVPDENNFTLCSGGYCVDEDSNPIPYGPPIVAGSSNGNYPGNPDFVGTPAPGQAACGIGFEKVAGVCFPIRTGLADPQGGIFQILSNLFTWLMGLFTTFAILAFVVSGIQYFMASGDEGMAETAKNNAKNALIGIVVGLSGFILLKAISAALSGQSYFF